MEDVRRILFVQQRGLTMQSRVTKLEAIMATLATRDDVARVAVTLHREISAQTWKITLQERTMPLREERCR